MATARVNSRDNILDAAQRVTAREGAGNLTLEKVAAECRLSKGGLLYNFPSKEALLEGMLERLVQIHRQRMEKAYEELRGQPNASLRACLQVWEPRGVLEPGVALSILAAAAQKPALLEPLRRHFNDIYQRVRQESNDVQQALLLWAAADGLLFHSLLGTAPYPEEQQPELVKALLRKAEELP